MSTKENGKFLCYGLLTFIGIATVLALVVPFLSYTYIPGRTNTVTDIGLQYLIFDGTTAIYDFTPVGGVILSVVCWATFVFGIITTISGIKGWTAQNSSISPKDGFVSSLVSMILVCFLTLVATIAVFITIDNGSDIVYSLMYLPCIAVVVLFIVRQHSVAGLVNNDGYVAPNVNDLDKQAQRQVAMRAGAEVGAKYSVQGAVGKSLVVYDNKCVISTRTTVRSVIVGSFTDGSKTIYFADLTGIQFKQASGVLLGYLQFETASTQSNRRNGNWTANYDSENSFTFESNINDLMKEISQFVYDKLEEYKENKARPILQQPAQQSVADKILELKKLLDAGAITQAEYDQMKKDLLNL